MFIKIKPESLRTTLQAIKQLYPADCSLYYSVSKGRMVFESSGVYNFNISFDVDDRGGKQSLALQKTNVATFTQHLSLLAEYSDLTISEIVITDEDGDDKSCNIKVYKELKEGKEDSVECVTLSKRLQVTSIADSEKESLAKNTTDFFVGERKFICPASIGVAAEKAHILTAPELFIKGKKVYCVSGDGVCRVMVDEFEDELEQDINADFVYNIAKLGAEQYDFYEDFVECEVGEVKMKLAIPSKVAPKKMSDSVLIYFESVEPEVRIYNNIVRAAHGSGVLRVNADGTLTLNDEVNMGAPYILPLKDKISTVTISEVVGRAAGDEWTVGTADFNGKLAAKVAGECEIIFSVKSL